MVHPEKRANPLSKIALPLLLNFSFAARNAFDTSFRVALPLIFAAVDNSLRSIFSASYLRVPALHKRLTSPVCGCLARDSLEILADTFMMFYNCKTK
jgi:hypothetical protein